MIANYKMIKWLTKKNNLLILKNSNKKDPIQYKIKKIKTVISWKINKYFLKIMIIKF